MPEYEIYWWKSGESDYYLSPLLLILGNFIRKIHRENAKKTSGFVNIYKNEMKVLWMILVEND